MEVLGEELLSELRTHHIYLPSHKVTELYRCIPKPWELTDSLPKARTEYKCPLSGEQAGTQGICRTLFHCAYQGVNALVFGKGTTVSVHPSKYLVIIDHNT